MFVDMRISLPSRAVLCLAVLAFDLLLLTGSTSAEGFTLLRPEVVLLVSAVLLAPAAGRIPPSRRDRKGGRRA